MKILSVVRKSDSDGNFKAATDKVKTVIRALA